jgi:FAD/FMN-containing dehydrogenase
MDAAKRRHPTVIDEEHMSIESLKSIVAGTVVARHEASYIAARAALIWNGRKPPRYPEFIVKAASVADVQATIRYAAANGLRVSARGGGHNWSGIALQEGIVLDLSALDHIHVDPIERMADVGPAVRNGEAARIFAEYGLAFPLGHCASVPLSGYLLGGGFGWNSGEWGVACFNVESVEVVTADGEVRRASATENADIFWAVRGAGPEFFGVVTAYRLKLHKLPRAITTSVWTYPIEAAAKVERWMNEAMAVVSRNVEFTVTFGNPPPNLADRVGKVATGIATVFADTETEAHATLDRIAALAPTGVVDIQKNIPTPFDVLYAIIGQFFPEGHRYVADTFWATPDAERFLELLGKETAKAPSAHSFSLGVVLPPAALAEPLPDAAFSMAGKAFGCAYAIWEDAGLDDAAFEWVRQTADTLKPLTIGAYIGEADLDRPGRVKGCFSATVLERLKQLQAIYDPTGMFQPRRPIPARLETAA